MENATEKFREGRPNFREDIKLFIGLPKQPLLELSPPVTFAFGFHGVSEFNIRCFKWGYQPLENLNL